MFIDRARIQVKAGDGGDGMSSFRREKFVPKGGPSGGDGGRGGDVVFIVDNNVNTLLDFRYKRKFVAKNGDNGQTKNCYGQKAEPLYIKVPPGTIIKDEESGEVLADLTEVGQETVIVRGGRGGRGNARFVSSINRSPTFSEKGEPGEGRSLVLELKLLADVGLVGYPSVGKSSLVSMVSAARPEIAEYHFTTLVPVLGVVSLGPEHSFVIADIPGLIEGAHEGVGLGHDFLRHVERTKIIVHVVDVSGIEGRDPIEDYQRINKELKLYNERLANRPQIVAANKMDLPEAQENYQRFKEFIESEGKEIFPISAATNEGLKELMIRVSKALDDYVEEPEAVAEVKVYEDSAEADFVIKRDEVGDFVVVSKSLEKLVAMTKFENDEALRRFQNIWRLKGVDEALKARGIKEGDTVHVGEMEFEFKE
ncbi:MAG: GTPase ObgE [Negativicutes bacterium]|nr:GTPase ObgE [Negativicutes bacterium]MBP8628612.1 GTPase ObgE [Negativicutes bacterium]MBP9536785.1 GTPase ObgE [Negativicutes bacterium]MBP9948769.1 GTPase ObgE [Negativicutes bacterium]